MDGYFITAIVLLIPAVIAIYFWRRFKRDQDVSGVRFARTATIAAGSLVLFFMAMASFRMIPVNQVAVFVNLGAPTSRIEDNGPVLKAPWQRIVTFDGRRQFYRFAGNGNEDAPAAETKVWPHIQVRLADTSATAFLSGSVEWQMTAVTKDDQKRVADLLKSYGNFDNLVRGLLSARIGTSFGGVFDGHNPLNPAKNQPLSALNTESRRVIAEAMGTIITIHSVQLNIPDYDETTDRAIQNLQAESANTATAIQKVETAKQEKLASDIFGAALRDNPEYGMIRCLDIAREAIAKGLSVEPGYCMLKAIGSLMLGAGRTIQAPTQ